MTLGDNSIHIWKKNICLNHRYWDSNLDLELLYVNLELAALNFQLKLVDGKEFQETKGFLNYVELALGTNFIIICLCNYDEVKYSRQKYIPWYYLEYPHVSNLHQMLTHCNTRVLTYLNLSWANKVISPLVYIYCNRYALIATRVYHSTICTGESW
jgi:hypothetical protein